MNRYLNRLFSVVKLLASYRRSRTVELGLQFLTIQSNSNPPRQTKFHPAPVMATIMEAFDPSIVAVAAGETSSSKKTRRTPAIPLFARGDSIEEMGTTSVVPRPLSYHPLQASLPLPTGDGWVVSCHSSFDHP